MPVSATLVLTAFVPPIFASETPVLRRFREGNRGSVLPSEGRGREFESLWVRQISAIFETAENTLSSGWLVLRPNVAGLFLFKRRP
jgi:hypothetical protein